MGKKLTLTEVGERYGGVHARTIARWLKDEKLGFPKPLVIGRRPLWDERMLAVGCQSWPLRTCLGMTRLPDANSTMSRFSLGCEFLARTARAVQKRTPAPGGRP